MKDKSEETTSTYRDSDMYNQFGGAPHFRRGQISLRNAN